ncbi:MAG TPA: PQQ-dependent sugar dehydrogenase [Chitinophagales bacterium]|nr:PQQ-dependent sugar dehydrogenase [Chitinophagales bacterium]
MSAKPVLLILSLIITGGIRSMAQPIIDLELITTGFNEPVDIASAGDERLFIVSRHGTIEILYPDLSVSTFLDIDDRVGSGGGEQGLQGLVFHPDYASNGFFYVNYTDTLGDTHISRFSVSAGDPDLADPDSELLLIYADQPANNHNSGDLNFGPDGYLWLCTGNGGGPANGNAQDTTSILGKVLRIDVDGGSPYAIPADNPFIGEPGVDEMWALGLRNPWRFSFDRLTGDLWIADVGGAIKEEVNFRPVSSGGGENYGWQCYEASYQSALCDTSIDFTFPIFEYNHNPFTGGYAITGGFVYRGNAYPHLYGYYTTIDYVTGNAWALHSDGMGGWLVDTLGFLVDHITSFGEDQNGEIYACEKDAGNIYRLKDLCGSFALTSDITDETALGVSDGSIDLTVTGGNAPYSISWSTGASSEDLSGLSADTYTVTVTDDLGCVQTGVYEVAQLCGPAIDVQVSDITTSSATISWSPSGAGLYKVQYITMGGTPGQITTPDTSVTLSGLDAGAVYVFRVRNKCSGTTATYTASGAFMTDPLRDGMVSGLEVFPNPTTGLLYLQSDMQDTPVLIRDVSGNPVMHYNVCPDVIDLSGLPNGMYILESGSERMIVLVQH